jgi:hypothetical protein
MDSLNSAKRKNDNSYRELFLRFLDLFNYLKSKWVRIFIASFCGSIIGLFLAIYTPIKYVAKLTFVVEETGNSRGGLSALAGQFGFDLGNSGGGSLFNGDNILLFLKSESLCRETLLTPYDEFGKLTLADRYAEVKGLKKRWIKSKDIGEINFAKKANKSFTRIEDSLLQLIIKKHILATDLSVLKPDKKSSFIQVVVSTNDEKLSALFSNRLVKIASDKYIESKIKIKAENVAILQRRADSLAEVLNYKTYKAANSQQILVDVNPAIRTAPINAEISAREKSMAGTIFAEVVKNLEIGKSILSQETPAIQVVDQSTFPLEKIKAGKLRGIILWGFLFGFFFSMYLLLINWIRKNINVNKSQVELSL